MRKKKNPHVLHRALYRSNTLVLEMLIAAFQVFAMLLLTLKTNPFDMQALLLMIAMPLCMAGALGLYSKFAPVDRAVYLLSAFLMSISLVILKDIARASVTVEKQALSMLVGFFAMGFGIWIIRRLRSWEKVAKALMIPAILALFAPYAIGEWTYGAKNWIRITGTLTIQPSEFGKSYLVFMLAALFSGETSVRKSLLPMACAAAFCVALLLERDLGALAIYFLVTCSVYYAASQNLLTTAIGLGLGAGGAVGAYHMFDYVKKRVEMFLNPWSDPEDSGYQIIQALIAIGYGGAFGTGLGLGYPRSVPLYSSDFVFASIGEEFGLLFAGGLLCVYILLLWRGVVIACGARRQFHALLSFGIVAMITIQAFVNVAGNTKLIPMTGLTLPLVSAGSNSVISTMLMLGMLLGVSSMNAEADVADARRALRKEEASARRRESDDLFDTVILSRPRFTARGSGYKASEKPKTIQKEDDFS
ncbi:MAG: FtsW/RodA/SpoVE family cell cycle protein [Christensenellales bacterium]|jgi:cell division protein FtsW (lipid II flippase)